MGCWFLTGNAVGPDGTWQDCEADSGDPPGVVGGKTYAQVGSHVETCRKYADVRTIRLFLNLLPRLCGIVSLEARFRTVKPRHLCMNGTERPRRRPAVTVRANRRARPVAQKHQRLLLGCQWRRVYPVKHPYPRP